MGNAESRANEAHLVLQQQQQQQEQRQRQQWLNEQGLPSTKSKHDLAQSMLLIKELTEDLFCAEEWAIQLVAEYGEQKVEIYKVILTNLTTLMYRGKPRPIGFRDKLSKSVHFKEISFLCNLGVHEGDAVHVLRKTRYDTTKAMRILIRDFHLKNFQRQSVDARVARQQQQQQQRQEQLRSPGTIRERVQYNEQMLDHLKELKISPWNPQMIRAVMKLKQSAVQARKQVSETKVDGTGTKSTSPHNIPSVESRLLLQQRLNNHGMTELIMEGDGNCQFRSISYELFGTQEFHAFVRRQAVSYITAHPEIFQVYFENAKEMQSYVQKMFQLRHWGDELTLKACADSFHVHVHVITSNEGFGSTYLVYAPETSLSTPHHCFLAYVSPIHYNVATLKEDESRKRLSGHAVRLFTTSMGPAQSEGDAIKENHQVVLN